MVAELSLLSRMVDFLSTAPAPADIVVVKAKEAEEARMDYLTERKSDGSITPDEADELKECLLAHHMMVIAKGNALVTVSRG